ncbi:hypothetical protein GF361_00325 [Candidatus Woesearchaeota archaeon]|nr:hypothetical protein [Candidatus Woesearchaeota archaeon]
MYQDDQGGKVMKFKKILKTNTIIGIIISLYFSIKGSMTNGWFTCMTLNEVQSCTVIGWVLQIIILSIIFIVILIGIFYGMLRLFKSVKKEKPEEKKKKKEETKKEKDPKKEEKKQEKPKKKIKI